MAPAGGRIYYFSLIIILGKCHLPPGEDQETLRYPSCYRAMADALGQSGGLAVTSASSRTCSLGTLPASETIAPGSRRSIPVPFNLPVDVLVSFYI